MELDKNQQAFFALLRAGLWEEAGLQFTACGLPGSGDEVEWGKVLDLAEEQSVVGLVAAGIECFKLQVSGFKIPKSDALQFVGRTMQLEQRNQAMNYFIGVLVEKMREAGVYTVLVKGQGVAQCYERPLWRSCGDVDLFLCEDDYANAKVFLSPLASSVKEEFVREKHLSMTIDGWTVELHGRLRGSLSRRINRELESIQDDTFKRGNVRVWDNGGVPIHLLGKENDIVYVFVHFLNHFYKEGVGLRQIFDWCRLLWTYRDEIDKKKIEGRIRRMGLVSEWKAFGTYAVEYLGMPIEAMPMYESSTKWVKKAERINDFIMCVGNMGHNRDMSHFSKKPYLTRKCISMGRRIGDLINHARIFPLDSLRFFPTIMFNGVRSAMRGE
jgi:hypothetical protein